MEITFANTRGSIRFSGNGDTRGLHIISVSGLDLPEKDRTLASYTGQDGVTERTAQYGQRAITIYGDWNRAEVSGENIDRMVQILAQPGTLHITGTEKIRTISVNAASFTLGDRKGEYQQFCVQLSCDFPHFTGGEVQSIPVYQKIEKITDTNVLPYVFTERINDVSINNPGSVAVEPVIFITGGEKDADTGEIRIYHQTNDKTMQIQHLLAAGETLRLDVGERKLSSSIEGDITDRISLDSFFADMCLEPGENVLHFTGEGDNVNMNCVLEYQPLYAEAIV